MNHRINMQNIHIVKRHMMPISSEHNQLIPQQNCIVSIPCTWLPPWNEMSRNFQRLHESGMCSLPKVPFLKFHRAVWRDQSISNQIERVLHGL